MILNLVSYRGCQITIVISTSNPPLNALFKIDNSDFAVENYPWFNIVDINCHIAEKNLSGKFYAYEFIDWRELLGSKQHHLLGIKHDFNQSVI